MSHAGGIIFLVFAGFVCTLASTTESSIEVDIQCFSCDHHAALSPSQDCLDRINITTVNLCESGPYCLQYETKNNSDLVVAGIGCGSKKLCNGTVNGSYNTLTLPDGSVMNYTCCSSDYCNCPHCQLPTVPPPFETNITDIPIPGGDSQCFFCTHLPDLPYPECLDKTGITDAILCDEPYCLQYETMNTSGLQIAGLGCGDSFLCSDTEDGSYHSIEIGDGLIMNYTCCSAEFCNCPHCPRPTFPPPLDFTIILNNSSTTMDIELSSYNDSTDHPPSTPEPNTSHINSGRDFQCFFCTHLPDFPHHECLDKIGITDAILCDQPYCLQYETMNASGLQIAGLGCGDSFVCSDTEGGSYHSIEIGDGLIMNYTCCSTEFCNCPHCPRPTTPPPLDFTIILNATATHAETNTATTATQVDTSTTTVTQLNTSTTPTATQVDTSSVTTATHAKTVTATTATQPYTSTKTVTQSNTNTATTATQPDTSTATTVTPSSIGITATTTPNTNNATTATQPNTSTGTTATQADTSTATTATQANTITAITATQVNTATQPDTSTATTATQANTITAITATQVNTATQPDTSTVTTVTQADTSTATTAIQAETSTATTAKQPDTSTATTVTPSNIGITATTTPNTNNATTATQPNTNTGTTATQANTNTATTATQVNTATQPDTSTATTVTQADTSTAITAIQADTSTATTAIQPDTNTATTATHADTSTTTTATQTDISTTTTARPFNIGVTTKTTTSLNAITATTTKQLNTNNATTATQPNTSTASNISTISSQTMTDEFLTTTSSNAGQAKLSLFVLILSNILFLIHLHCAV